MEDRRRTALHAGIPLLLAFSLVGLYFVPKELFGCVNRGLLALSLMALSALGAIACMALAVRQRGKDPAASQLWLVTALALLMPSLCVAAFEVALAR